jgi:amidohydrolase
MIEDGAFGAPLPEAIFALHGWPGLPVGSIGYRFGPTMASVDDFELTIIGRGAHGAMPHTGVDPIVIAAHVIEGIQHVRSRMLDPLDPAVVTVGTIHSGTAVNIIPDRVIMTGTIRTLDPDTRRRIPDLLRTMATETARASGGEAVFTLTNGYPPTINDNRATAFVRDTALAAFESDRVIEILRPTMGGEDFAYYLERIPGAFFRLGMGDRPPLHNGTYDFDDAAIPTGIRIMAGIAVAFLGRGLPDN